MSQFYSEAKPVITNLAKFNVHPERGFLPAQDPLACLPQEFAAWEEIARKLSKYLAAGTLRDQVAKLPLLLATDLGENLQKWHRAHQLLAYLAHAEVLGGTKVKPSISSGVAIPLCYIAHYLKIPPLLSYVSYALHNWRRFDPSKPIELGNIALIQNFLGGLDEEWFILVHVDIEAQAAPALSAILDAQRAVGNRDPSGLQKALGRAVLALKNMNRTFARMPERCDPYIYYHRVRPYIHGWKNNPALPHGVVYEGITKWCGAPQKFYGETGAQSSVIPALDRLFGITFTQDDLTIYEDAMLNYMPSKHCAFLAAIEQGPSVRNAVKKQRKIHAELRDTYNAGVEEIAKFLRMHLRYAQEYIFAQSQKSIANPSAVGTGGSPFMRYLKKHLDETLAHRL